ncbi:MAG: serine/threonine protein kinase [Bacillariaceae sp.]|jgi:serine/threonine protein kinase
MVRLLPPATTRLSFLGSSTLLIAIACTLSFSYDSGVVLAFGNSKNNNNIRQQQQLVQRPLTTESTSGTSSGTSTSSSTRLYIGVPKIDEWTILKSGAVKGTVSNHPELPDGYEITTSPLDVDKAVAKNNGIVITASGSKYKLLKTIDSKPTKPKPTITIPKQPVAPVVKKKSAPVVVVKKKTATPAVAVKAVVKKPSIVNNKAVVAPQPLKKKSHDLNGKVVCGNKGSKKYLLVGKLIRSSSKRSQIYYAYEADKDDQPSGSRLTVKLSNYFDRLSRENKNYDRVASKGRVAFSFKGSDSCFVRKVDFIPNCDDVNGVTKGIPPGSSALVLESGDQNLRVFLSDSKQQQQNGLSGSELRKAAVNVCRCVEAMHSSGLVWTDLKAENFVLTGNTINNDQEVKGIDLESCVPFKSNPEDYSPEATPPEFALAEKQNIGFEFKVEKNYDIWSLGMLLLELSTGKSYFKGKSEDSITKLLANAESTIIDPKTMSLLLNDKQINAINDTRLQDLILSCLQLNPNKRPSIGQVLLHPYFLTTGIGPITF